jgi:hypothetical protein
MGVLDREDQEFVRAAFEKHKIREIQEQRQQGLGRNIVSTQFKGHRVVGVGNRIFTSDRWKTFHDFLLHYARHPFGKEWWLAEMAKDGDAMHPAIRWAKLTYEWQLASQQSPPGGINSTTPNGAALAYLRLGYDLYCVAHNNTLQERLIHRLKDAEHFWGARYELWVAATLFRAGFDVQFIDENDRSSTHCEFVATHQKSGRKFSVEAKFRVANRFRVGRHLCKALRKQADHERLVFIDINEPHADAAAQTPPAFLSTALATIRGFEGRKVEGKELPPAYVFVTNQPNHHHLDSTNLTFAALVEGFQIPEFKGDVPKPGLRAALAARERHKEVIDIFESMEEHQTIPSTFDGEIEEYAFGPQMRRFTVGHFVEVELDGARRAGKITSAIVAEENKVAHLALHFEEDDKAIIYPVHLTDEEFSAWKKYPDTFFGVVQQRKTKLTEPTEIFEFFFNAYQHTPKETLLQHMAGSPDIQALKERSQSELAKEYAIRCAEFTLARGNAEAPHAASSTPRQD